MAVTNHHWVFGYQATSIERRLVSHEYMKEMEQSARRKLIEPLCDFVNKKFTAEITRVEELIDPLTFAVVPESAPPVIKAGALLSVQLELIVSVDE